MLTRNQKSKMVYDVKEVKEYFHKRFNELKKSLDVNNNTLIVRLNQISKNQKVKWNQIRNSFSSN